MKCQYIFRFDCKIVSEFEVICFIPKTIVILWKGFFLKDINTELCLCRLNYYLTVESTLQT